MTTPPINDVEQKAKNDAALLAIKAALWDALFAGLCDVQQLINEYARDEIISAETFPVTDPGRWMHGGQAAGAMWCQMRLQGALNGLVAALREVQQNAEILNASDDGPVQ